MMAATAFCGTILPNGDAYAQSTGPSSSELRVAFSVWEPFVIDDETGRHGIDMAILTELAHRMDKALSLYPCPWRRCLKMLEDGDIDILSSFAYTAEREKFAFYIKPPYSRVSPVFYVRQGKNTHIAQFPTDEPDRPDIENHHRPARRGFYCQGTCTLLACQ
ncbi:MULTISPECIES: transporter substrate-binding domain-containing protein [Thalassospira]|uniref:substrate-binding periplasmic protein n=1 Tax=Thalassospira TaxID=168934 RepID=UPI00158706B5|nr:MULTISPECIES: transporter substrate-binding domain-containing protein [Thalassospira]MDM7976558.1 transporter substrate-binding domain-containing protein [Thalassospira xiamenensis]